MSTFPAELIARYGIIVAGGKLPAVKFQEDLPPYFAAEDNAAQAFVDSWVNSRVPKDLRRGPLLCATGVDLRTSVITVTNRFDYGHFVALRNEADRVACYDAYIARSDAAFESSLTRDAFLRIAKPIPLANAVWVITSDNKALCVRRSNLDLDPGKAHCNGGKVAVPEPGQAIDLEADALQRLKIETGVPSGDIEEVTYLGLCRNAPFDEVIALFAVRTALTKRQVNAVYKKAREPDGGVEWRNFDIRTIQQLLRRSDLTPSFQALLCLFLHQLTEESPPGK